MYNLEKDIPYNVFFFDPSTGRTFDRGTLMHVDNKQIVFEDDFSKDIGTRWSDDGSPSKIEDGQLVTQENALVILNEDIGQYLSVSVDAKSDQDAGIIVNYQDKGNYLVGLYSSLENKMYFYDVIDGHNGEPLGAGRGPLTRGPTRAPMRQTSKSENRSQENWDFGRVIGLLSNAMTISR